jgi:hypothetical protein
VLHSILVFALVGLQQFILIAEPRALASAVHLARSPTALVLVVDANESPKALDLVVLEIALVDRTVSVLDASLPMPHIAVEIPLVVGAVLEGGLPVALERTGLPDASVLALRTTALVDSLSVRLVLVPFAFVAVALRGNQSPKAFPLAVEHFSLVEETLIVEDDGLVLVGCWLQFADEGALGTHC